MTTTQILGFVALYTLGVCVAYDLVFARHDRRARRSAEARAHRLHRELERRDRAGTLRSVTPVSGSSTLDERTETGNGAQVVPLRSRSGPRRRRRATHPSMYEGTGS